MVEDKLRDKTFCPYERPCLYAIFKLYPLIKWTARAYRDENVPLHGNGAEDGCHKQPKNPYPGLYNGTLTLCLEILEQLVDTDGAAELSENLQSLHKS